MRLLIRFSGIASITLAAILVEACNTATGPRLIGEGTRILFIGNSHTYVNDVPGILQALADSGGDRKLAVMSVAPPNYALIDHVYDAETARQLAKGGWAYVVMQQGWTPAGVCQDTLRLAASLFATPIEAQGGTPALYQTWPPANRPGQWQGTIESYRLAAKDIDGLLFPVAEAWLAARQRAPTLSLYQDGLHANTAGAYLAALVMYARIFDTTPIGLPARLRTHGGLTVNLDAALAQLLQEAAAEVTLVPTPDTPPTAQPVITSRC